MGDDIGDSLRNLKSNIPAPRKDLSEAEKDQLVKAVGGPKTARSIVKAKKDSSAARIPFLFSSIDSQLVVDVISNDLEAAIARALVK